MAVLDLRCFAGFSLVVVNGGYSQNVVLRLLIAVASLVEPPKIKSDTVSTVSPSVSHEVMGQDAIILFF